MAGACSIDRNFEPSCKTCRSIFTNGLTIYCVVDTYDETTYADIDAAFLTREEAENYKVGRENTWLTIEEVKVYL
jgi:hypothetical protein